MTRVEHAFPWLVLGSLAVHAAGVAFLALAPGGSGQRNDRVQVYSVQIVEAPAPPEARILPLEPPVNRPALTAPLIAPAAPALPKAVPPALTAAPGKAPGLPAPVPGGHNQVLLAPPPLPEVSRAPKPGQPPPPFPAAPSAAGGAPESGEADGSLSAVPSPAQPLELLKRKVDQMKLQVETPAAPRPGARETDQDSSMSLRLFHNAVRERVQKNYSFPGTFPPHLRTRVRLVVARDGSERSAEIVQSSGNERFDQLVCLAAIRNSRFPPVPDAVPGDTVTMTLTCSP